MPAIGEDDPGRSYRRGYQDGAVETFRAIERFLDVATREVVRTWIERDVNDWRLKATLSHPPTWRLNNAQLPALLPSWCRTELHSPAGSAAPTCTPPIAKRIELHHSRETGDT